MKMRYLIVGMLFVAGLARAEEGCPPGLFPNTSGAAGGGCVPYSSNAKPSTYQAPIRWKNHWGALVVATKSNGGSGGSVLGISEGMESKSQAKKTALMHCKDQGGVDCKLEMTYVNQCAAIAWGDEGRSVVREATIEKATKLAMEGCTASGYSNCSIYYSVCSYPERVW